VDTATERDGAVAGRSAVRCGRHEETKLSAASVAPPAEEERGGEGRGGEGRRAAAAAGTEDAAE